MDYEIRPCKENEIEEFIRTCMMAFSEEPKEGDISTRARVIEPERTLAAFDEDSMVATTAAFSFRLTIPGAEVPAAGVTLVGVLPTHRRRGILKAMMKRQLEDCHALGEPVAILWASEGAIYPNFGYGLASYHGLIDLDRDKAQFRDETPPAGRARIVSYDEFLKIAPDVYERVRAQTPGMFARSRTWWEAHRLFDPEHEREGGGPMLRAVVEINGTAQAYCLYRVQHSWGEDGIPNGTLTVEEAMGTTPEATKAVWHFLFGVDLVARLKYFFIQVDHPLKFMLRALRPLRLKVADALWLRVLDVKKALEARTYATAGTLVLDLHDSFCPWNEGVWKLDVSEEGDVAVSQSTKEADIRLEAEQLGAVYLGGVSFSELAAASRLTELNDGALLRANLLFHTDKQPWCPELF